MADFYPRPVCPSVRPPQPTYGRIVCDVRRSSLDRSMQVNAWQHKCMRFVTTTMTHRCGVDTDRIHRRLCAWHMSKEPGRPHQPGDSLSARKGPRRATGRSRAPRPYAEHFSDFTPARCDIARASTYACVAAAGEGSEDSPGLA